MSPEYRAVIISAVTDGAAVPVEQDRVQAQVIKSRDVLGVEGLALFVGKVVAVDVKIGCRAAFDLARPHVIEDGPVQLVQAHDTPSGVSWKRDTPIPVIQGWIGS